MAPEESQAVATVYVLNQRTRGVLDALTAAGAPVAVRWDGTTLTLEVA